MELSEGDGAYSHQPVMPERILELLALRPGSCVVDGTVGLGGHSRLFAQATGETGRLICFDRDPEALARAGIVLADAPCRVDFVNRSFQCMDKELERLGAPGADGILLDLGVSSLQLDKPERGFSFMRDGPLDMRMQQGVGMSAREVINTWPEEELAKVFHTLGEERFSRRLAKSIVERRALRPIETTGELSKLAEETVPYRGRIHPATRLFQAVRLLVNDELGTLSKGLAAAGRTLAPGGRLAVLTFHSLEDRVVKRTFLRWRDLGAACLLTAGAESCGREEARRNRRARSAKLRVVEKI